jgi:hypothetical protein
LLPFGYWTRANISEEQVETSAQTLRLDGAACGWTSGLLLYLLPNSTTSHHRLSSRAAAFPRWIGGIPFQPSPTSSVWVFNGSQTTQPDGTHRRRWLYHGCASTTFTRLVPSAHISFRRPDDTDDESYSDFRCRHLIYFHSCFSETLRAVILLNTICRTQANSTKSQAHL